MKQIKSLILSVSLVLVLFVLSTPSKEIPKFVGNSFETSSILTELKCNYGQCYATAKSTGNRCLHCVSKSGDSYCWQHKD